HGTQPPAKNNDPAWARHVSGYVTNYLRRLRKHMKARAPRVELAVGIPSIAPYDQNRPMISRAVDWRAWVDEGLVDTLVINYVEWDDKRPLESTREMYREVLDYVDGRCRVLCPIQQYDYSHRGLPAYEKATGKSNADVAAALTRMAHEVGADGISLECVDYNNYKPNTRKILRELTSGSYRNVRKP
ncbi:MAG: family 10 glycosylhydrolase, partial [Pirellulales bacterium]|nr:family 10 glycosylhydrolase [Pirellulales bacterium]